MASPWKLLARLVSPRRQPKVQTDAADHVVPDPSAIDVQENAGNKGSATKDTDDFAFEKLGPIDQSIRSDDPRDSDKAASGVASTADPEKALGLVDAAEPGLQNNVDPVLPASMSTLPGKGKALKRSRRGKQAEAADVISHATPNVVIPPNTPLSLDEEIRSLREQLANRLRLQNAQLTKMLARFDD